MIDLKRRRVAVARAGEDASVVAKATGTRVTRPKRGKRVWPGMGPSPPDTGFDALLPPAMAQKAEMLGVAKAHLPSAKLFVLALLAGAFIALGALFSSVAVVGAEVLPFGVARILGGLTFSLGLVLVVVGGAELFTGNNLIVMAWASGKVRGVDMLRNWAIVYVANFAGAVSVALLAFLADEHRLGADRVGSYALSLALAKVSLPFMTALFRGVLCNVLVCLAVWLCMSARSTGDKILAIVGPVTAFVATGLEHSVANMYFLPFALLIKQCAPAEFWSAIQHTPSEFSQLTPASALVSNLVPVTLGNILGGAGFVGLVYWFVYLRQSRSADGADPG